MPKEHRSQLFTRRCSKIFLKEIEKLQLVPEEPRLTTLGKLLMSGIRFVAGKAAKGRTAIGTIQLLCHVKPGASANREGIAAVTNDAIEICVASQAREGEANTAVRGLIAKILKVPKSDVDITRGLKSRDKTITVRMGHNMTPAQEIERIRVLLSSSAAR